MSNVVVKQGKPSAPGTVVDTSKAKVVPTSPEVRAEGKKRGGTPDLKAALETGVLENAVRKPSAKAGKDKAKPAAGKPAKARGTGNGSGPTTRITEAWTGKDRKEVNVKDHVAHGEFVGVVKGRWTKRKGDQLIPMVTLTLDKPKGGQPRHNAPAKECTHVK